MHGRQISFAIARILLVFFWIRLVKSLSPRSVTFSAGNLRNGASASSNLTNSINNTLSTSVPSTILGNGETITSDLTASRIDSDTLVETRTNNSGITRITNTSFELSSTGSTISEHSSSAPLATNSTHNSSDHLATEVLYGYLGSTFLDVTYTGGSFPTSCPQALKAWTSKSSMAIYNSWTLSAGSPFFEEDEDASIGHKCINNWCRAQYMSLFPDSSAEEAYTRVTSGSFYVPASVTSMSTLGNGQITSIVSETFIQEWGTSTYSGAHAKYGGLWGSPCCGACTMTGEPVQIRYWPPSTSGQPDPYTLIVGNDTYISPTVYATFRSLMAENLCSTIGEDKPQQKFKFRSTHFWSVSPLPAATGDGIGIRSNYVTSHVNWADHYTYVSESCSGKPLPTAGGNLDYNNYDPCFPRVSFPWKWQRQLDNRWTECAAPFDWSGYLDPPTVLRPQTELAGDQPLGVLGINDNFPPSTPATTTGTLVTSTDITLPSPGVLSSFTDFPKPTQGASSPVPNLAPSAPGVPPPMDDPPPMLAPSSPHNPEPAQNPAKPTVVVPNVWSDLTITINDNRDIMVGGQTLTPGQGTVTVSGTPVAVGTDRAVYADDTLLGWFPQASNTAGGGEVSTTMIIGGVAWHVGEDREVYSNGEVVATLVPESFEAGGEGYGGGIGGDALSSSIGLGDFIWNGIGGEVPGSTGTEQSGGIINGNVNSTATPPIAISKGRMLVARTAKTWIWVCICILYGALR